STFVADVATVQQGLDAVGPGGGVVEIADSGRYQEALSLNASNRRVTLRAAVGSRPTIVLPDDLHLVGGGGDAVVLDGLLITGAAVVVDAGPSGAPGLGRLELRHCTLVPGLSLAEDRSPVKVGSPSLVVASPGTGVD